MKIFKMSITASILLILFFAACRSKQQKTPESSNTIDTASYLQKGDSISAIVQKVLLTNVLQATKYGGPGYAVTFCNEQAMPLTDSLAKAHNCLIQRLSDKFRNPANKLSGNDVEIFSNLSSSNSIKPVIVFENRRVVYYKPIKIAMAACLKCHGQAGKDIDVKTMEIISQKYTDDLATGYKEGDLRGLWKITFLGE